jgi:glutathione synthase/RimK-type ligase-like ATP-grasp enzyme
MEILGCRKCRPTGRILAERLQARYIEEHPRDPIVIRYGNSYSSDPVEGLIINKQEAVRLSSNKPLCKRTLIEHNIPTPRYYTFEEVRSGHIPFPVIVRRNGHSQGRWFYIVNNVKDINRYDPSRHYIQEMVDKIDEYRLFVMKDRLIEADLKVPPENDPHAMIRNHAKGSYFQWVRVGSLNPDLKRAVRDAVQLIGLDFAAVDCSTIRTPQGVKSTIFEVNSAPGLIDRKAELFVNKLHELYLD